MPCSAHRESTRPCLLQVTPCQLHALLPVHDFSSLRDAGSNVNLMSSSNCTSVGGCNQEHTQDSMRKGMDLKK